MNAFLDRLLALPPEDKRSFGPIVSRFIWLCTPTNFSPRDMQWPEKYIAALATIYPLYALLTLSALYLFSFFSGVAIDLPFITIEYPTYDPALYFAESFSFYAVIAGYSALIYPALLMIKHIDFRNINVHILPGKKALLKGKVFSRTKMILCTFAALWLCNPIIVAKYTPLIYGSWRHKLLPSFFIDGAAGVLVVNLYSVFLILTLLSLFFFVCSFLLSLFLYQGCTTEDWARREL